MIKKERLEFCLRARKRERETEGVLVSSEISSYDIKFKSSVQPRRRRL